MATVSDSGAVGSSTNHSTTGTPYLGFHAALAHLLATHGAAETPCVPSADVDLRNERTREEDHQLTARSTASRRQTELRPPREGERREKYVAGENSASAKDTERER